MDLDLVEFPDDITDSVQITFTCGLCKQKFNDEFACHNHITINCEKFKNMKIEEEERKRNELKREIENKLIHDYCEEFKKLSNNKWIELPDPTPVWNRMQEVARIFSTFLPQM